MQGKVILNKAIMLVLSTRTMFSLRVGVGAHGNLFSKFKMHIESLIPTTSMFVNGELHTYKP